MGLMPVFVQLEHVPQEFAASKEHVRQALPPAPLNMLASLNLNHIQLLIAVRRLRKWSYCILDASLDGLIFNTLNEQFKMNVIDTQYWFDIFIDNCIFCCHWIGEDVIISYYVWLLVTLTVLLFHFINIRWM